MSLPAKQPRPKTCKNPACGVKFRPMQMGQKVCGWKCGLAIAPDQGDKAAKALRQHERKETRVRKEKLKTRSDHMKECQRAFNEFIRWRDRVAGHACISSGRHLDWSGNMTDCGHYRSVGSSPHLRFDERNAHAQSKHDNQFLSGNVVAYRLGLIARIGLDAVEELECDQEPRKYSTQDLIDMAAEYRAKTRDLKKLGLI